MRAYERDYYRWAMETASALRSRDIAAVDMEALAEEVEDLGKRERAALESRVGVLIGHLLKWEYQPGKRGASWEATIALQRRKVGRLLRDNPSLRGYMAGNLGEMYEEGVLLAVKETGLERGVFPVECPWGMEELVDGATGSDRAGI